MIEVRKNMDVTTFLLGKILSYYNSKIEKTQE